jgi:type I restriction enzyme S subunit
MFDGSIAWVKSAELNQGEISDTEEKLTNKGYRSSSARWVPQNTPLIAMYGATAGVVGWLKTRATTNQAVLAIPPRSHDTDSRWLYWTLQHHASRLLASIQGSGQPNLSKTLIDQLDVGYPTLPEQRRIAEILDTADEAIRQTERVIAKLKAVKAGLLHDLLTRGLDEHSRLRDPVAHPEQFKDSPLGRIPGEWEVMRCESVCNEIVVGIVIRPAQYYVATGVPALRSKNVHEDGPILDDLVHISEQSNRLLAKSMLRHGDVITVRSGYPGTSCVVPQELDGANSIDLIISRPRPSIMSEYLATWINSDFGKGQILRLQGGLAQQHFNVGEMQKLLIALPSLEEQQRITSVLDAHSARICAEQAALCKLRQVKRGLMDDLLTGRVRVNH